MPKNLFSRKQHLRSSKIAGNVDFFIVLHKLAYVVCNIIQGKKLGVTVLLSDIRSIIHDF